MNPAVDQGDKYAYYIFGSIDKKVKILAFDLIDIFMKYLLKSLNISQIYEVGFYIEDNESKRMEGTLKNFFKKLFGNCCFMCVIIFGILMAFLAYLFFNDSYSHIIPWKENSKQYNNKNVIQDNEVLRNLNEKKEKLKLLVSFLKEQEKERVLGVCDTLKVSGKLEDQLKLTNDGCRIDAVDSEPDIVLSVYSPMEKIYQAAILADIDQSKMFKNYIESIKQYRKLVGLLEDYILKIDEIIVKYRAADILNKSKMVKIERESQILLRELEKSLANSNIKTKVR